MPRRAKSHDAGRHARRWFARHLRRWADALDPPAAPVLPAIAEDDGPRVGGPPVHWLAHIAQAGGDPVWLGSAGLLSPPAAHGPQRWQPPARMIAAASVRAPRADAERVPRSADPRGIPVTAAVPATRGLPLASERGVADSRRVSRFEPGVQPGVTSSRGREVIEREVIAREVIEEDRRPVQARPSSAPAIRPRRPTVAPSGTSELWRQVDSAVTPSPRREHTGVVESPHTAVVETSVAESPVAWNSNDAQAVDGSSSRSPLVPLARQDAVAERHARPRPTVHASQAAASQASAAPVTAPAIALERSDPVTPFDPWPGLAPPSSTARTSGRRPPSSSGLQFRVVPPAAVPSDRWPELPPPPDLTDDAAWNAMQPGVDGRDFGRLDGLRGE